MLTKYPIAQRFSEKKHVVVYPGECLNREVFRHGRKARTIAAAWREHYNTERPHSSLRYPTPDEFAAQGEGGAASPIGSLRPPTKKAENGGQPSNSNSPENRG